MVRIISVSRVMVNMGCVHRYGMPGLGCILGSECCFPFPRSGWPWELLSLSSLHNAGPNGHLGDRKNGSPISLSGPQWERLPSPHTEPRGLCMCMCWVGAGMTASLFLVPVPAVGTTGATPQALPSPEVTSIWGSCGGRRREPIRVSLTGDTRYRTFLPS